MDVKAKYLLLELRMLDVKSGDCIVEARRRGVRHGDDFDGLGGHFANQEAPEVSSPGSWLLCTPSLFGSTSFRCGTESVVQEMKIKFRNISIFY